MHAKYTHLNRPPYHPHLGHSRYLISAGLTFAAWNAPHAILAPSHSLCKPSVQGT